MSAPAPPILFCTRCGQRLAAGRCPTCQPEPRFCVTCGDPLAGPGCPRCQASGPLAAEAAAFERVHRASPARLYVWLAFVLGWGALNLVLYETVGSGDQSSSGLPDVFTYAVFLSSVIAYGVFVGVMLAITAGLPLKETFGLRRPTSWWHVVWAVPCVVVGSLVVAGLLEGVFHGGRDQGVTPDQWVPGHTAAYVLSFVAIAVIAPIVEELTFRGVGFALLRRYGEWVAIVAVGACFALAHGIPATIPALLPFGWGVTFMRSRLKSVYPGMLAHGLYNGVVMLAIFIH